MIISKIILSAILLTTFMSLSNSNDTSDIVTISSGNIEGFHQNGVRTFLSVPYAAPPVGENRFKKPQPVTAWPGIRDARVAGATAPQSVSSLGKLDLTPIVGTGWIHGDDYLTLNVWTPENATKRPVMVYIHGGGFTVGSKDAAVYNGTSFARSGVVSVNINYRLGIEGFLPIPGVPTNLAMRDIIAALKWVQSNIEAFGGDPANVTVFGESGGGNAVACLVASPLTKGLFSKAIVESGSAAAVYSKEIAQRLVKKVADELKIIPDLAGFKSTTYEDCLKAQAKVSKLGAVDLRDENGIDPGFGVGRFAVVYGDDVLPEPPLTLLKHGAGRDINLLMTTTSQEANIFFVPSKLQWVPGFVAKWYLKKSMPKDNVTKVLKAYGLGDKGKSGGLVLTYALTDLGFRWPSRQFAQAHQGPTHVMEFNWESPAMNGKLGACHSIDLPFVFNTIATVTGENGMLGTNPPKELGTFVHQMWVNFAETGSLPWSEFNTHTRLVYQLTSKRATFEPIMPAAKFLSK